MSEHGDMDEHGDQGAAAGEGGPAGEGGAAGSGGAGTAGAGPGGLSDLERLLAVQARDTAADRLRHRRATLPEREALAALGGAMAGLRERLAEATARRDTAAAAVRRLEGDLAATEARIAEVDKRLYSGEVTASRELQAMAADVESMKQRRSSLEDEALSAMEALEPESSEVAELSDQLARHGAEAEGLREAIAAEEAVIDAEVVSEEATRVTLAADVPDALLATYDRLRAKMGGVGAARLVGSSCSGCHLTLPATELARLRAEPPGTVLYCDQCGRILVV